MRHRPESGDRVRPRSGPGAASTVGLRAGSRSLEPIAAPAEIRIWREVPGARQGGLRTRFRTNRRLGEDVPSAGTLMATDRLELPPLRPGWSRLALTALVKRPAPMAMLMDLVLLLGAEFGIAGQAGTAPS